MTTRTRPRPASVTAYYLGRPAAFWLTALAPRRPAGNPQLVYQKTCYPSHLR